MRYVRDIVSGKNNGIYRINLDDFLYTKNERRIDWNGYKN